MKAPGKPAHNIKSQSQSQSQNQTKMKEKWDRYRAGSDTYTSGDHYVICDRCGFKVRRSDARRTWDNLIVCPFDYEARHPQDFKRGRRDKIAVDDARPEQADIFLSDNEVQASDL